MKKNSGTFTLAEVLSITTGRLLCDIGKVYEILNYMTGDDLYTHQLPRAGEQCKPVLFSAFPELKNVSDKELGVLDEFLKVEYKPIDACNKWIKYLLSYEHGLHKTYDVPKLKGYTPKGPIQEFIEMREKASA